MKVCDNALGTKRRHQDVGEVKTDVEYEIAGKYESSKGPSRSERGRLLFSPPRRSRTAESRLPLSPEELEMTKGRRPSNSGHSLDPRLQLVLVSKVLLSGNMNHGTR